MTVTLKLTDASKAELLTLVREYETSEMTRDEALPKLRTILLPYQDGFDKEVSFDLVVEAMLERIFPLKPPYRVKVMDGSGSSLLGYGTYVGDVSVYIIVSRDGASILSQANAEEPPSPEMIPEGSSVSKSDENPKIILDDGRVVYGCQVWWEPALAAPQA